MERYLVVDYLSEKGNRVSSVRYFVTESDALTYIKKVKALGHSVKSFRIKILNEYDDDENRFLFQDFYSRVGSQK